MNMLFTKIWERYFFFEVFKVFLLFLIGFYGLYVIIDYSTHARSFHNYHFKVWEIFSYYGYEFIGKMDVLIPFAILIACIKTLCSLNIHNELAALLTSGLTLKRLLLPFVLFGLIFTGVIYFNLEVLQPRALTFHKQLEHRRAKEKRKKHHHPYIQKLPLEDGSTLIFQSYNEIAKRFEDAYWVKSIDHIYRIDRLEEEPFLKGFQIEQLKRNSAGILEIVEFIEEQAFPQIRYNREKLLDSVSSPNDYSLSALRDKLPIQNSLSDKEAEWLTTYYSKIAMPWLCLLAVIAPAPFCLRFTRTLPQFYIYACSLFGLVTFYLILDAAILLGERQVISPWLAIWVPFTLVFGFFGFRFARLA